MTAATITTVIMYGYPNLNLMEHFSLRYKHGMCLQGVVEKYV